MTSESKTMLQVIPSYFSLLLEVPGRSLIKTSFEPYIELSNVVVILPVTAPLLNARQQARGSRVLGVDNYKQMPRVTVCVAR